MLDLTWQLLLYPFVVLASHRLWNREDIFEKPRQWAAHIPFKGVNCEVCNLFWIALLWALLLPLPATALHPLYLALAAYGPLRGLIALYDAPFAASQPPVEAGATEEPSKEGCQTCQKGRQAFREIEKQQKVAMLFKRRAVFVTDYTDWSGLNPMAMRLLEHVAVLARSSKWFVRLVIVADPTSYETTKIDIEQRLAGLGLTHTVQLTVLKEPHHNLILQELFITGNGLTFLELKDPYQDSWQKLRDDIEKIKGFGTIYYGYEHMPRPINDKQAYVITFGRKADNKFIKPPLIVEDANLDLLDSLEPVWEAEVGASV